METLPKVPGQPDDKVGIDQDANVFSAEGTGGPRIQIITKPGTGPWSGNIALNFNDESLNAKNPLLTNKPQKQQRQIITSYGGPLIPGKLTLRVNLRDLQIEQEGNAIRAVTPDGAVNREVHARMVARQPVCREPVRLAIGVGAFFVRSAAPLYQQSQPETAPGVDSRVPHLCQCRKALQHHNRQGRQRRSDDERSTGRIQAELGNRTGHVERQHELFETILADEA